MGVRRSACMHCALEGSRRKFTRTPALGGGSQPGRHLRGSPTEAHVIGGAYGASLGRTARKKSNLWDVMVGCVEGALHACMGEEALASSRSVMMMRSRHRVWVDGCDACMARRGVRSQASVVPAGACKSCRAASSARIYWQACEQGERQSSARGGPAGHIRAEGRR